MQTFLCYADFDCAAKVLDSRRLNNQRNEAKTILYINEDKYRNTPWDFHPAVRMWRGYSRALIDYIRAIHEECLHRKIKPAIWQQILVDFGSMMDEPILKPSW